MAKRKKFIFVTGGVLSSVGKGICAASLGMLMEHRGIKVTMVKMDPYLNVDPGTMNPLQHGEVFVLDDGAETDLDLGHYSRFVQNAKFTTKNSFTSGRIYDAVIRRERSGGYLGKTIQVIPHITDEIKNNIRDAAQEADLAIVEIGGTVGDIESQPFLEAIRQLRHEEGSENVLFAHVTLVPFISTAGELKTKPTQHSVKELREIGVQPDILLCRSDRKIPAELKEKIGLFCNVAGEQVFSAADVSSIYEVPMELHREGVDEKIVELLGIWTGRPNFKKWNEMVERVREPKGEVTIGLVGKYTDLHESYKSLSEALVHGGVRHDVRVKTQYFDSDKIESGAELDLLKQVDAILVPGGFGERGIEGKIKAIEYARKNNIPFLGICLGLQLAVIEFARNVCGMKHASSTEFTPEGTENVIALMEAQKNIRDKGGTMRLGAYPCNIRKEIDGNPTFAYQAYADDKIQERHRHRYEVSDEFRSKLEDGGLVVSGVYKNGSGIELVEMIEMRDHPWFLGCQFHPEFLSKPLNPHPLFASFIGAAKKQRGVET